MLRLYGMVIILQCQGSFQGVGSVLTADKAAQANKKLRTGQKGSTSTRLSVAKRAAEDREASHGKMDSLWREIPETVIRTERLKKEISKRQVRHVRPTC